jgi:hypothetical protein
MPGSYIRMTGGTAAYEKEQARKTDASTETRSGKRLKAIVSALAALGVVSAITAYYVPGILKSGGSLIIDQAPIDYSATVVPDTPNYVFPASLPPAKVPSSLMRHILRGRA